MLLINAHAAPSSVHGLGLFADQFIPKGTVVWEFTPLLDTEIPITEFKKLPQKAREFIEFHGFLSQRSGNWHLSFDDVRYINHSERPNVASDTNREGVQAPLVAIRDIKRGEEMLQNYNDFEQHSRFVANR